MPIISGGGGGAAFNGGTIHSPFVVDTGALATAGGVTIQGTDGSNVNRLKVDYLHTLLELTGDGVFTVSSDDALGVNFQGTADSTSSLSVTDTPANTEAVMRADSSGGSVSVTGPSFALIAAMSYNLGLMTALNAAPSDGSLSAGQCALWFDQTNGAAKLMVKGKSANGTVVAAAIALS